MANHSQKKKHQKYRHEPQIAPLHRQNQFFQIRILQANQQENSYLNFHLFLRCKYVLKGFFC